MASMPRLARAVAVGFAHHITHRGNNRQDVFFVDDDHRVYLKLLKEQADTLQIHIHQFTCFVLRILGCYTETIYT